eukprot:720560-Ditylum_brightwellii.AAC.1
MCPKKADEDATEKDKKSGPAGHAHVTTDDVIEYDEGDKDEDYGDWGSLSIGGFMFHQHGAPSPTSHKNTIRSKWADAADHLLQQSDMKGKINRHWI